MKDQRLSESRLRSRYFSIIPVCSHQASRSRSIAGKSTLDVTGLNIECSLNVRIFFSVLEIHQKARPKGTGMLARCAPGRQRALTLPPTQALWKRLGRDLPSRGCTRSHSAGPRCLCTRLSHRLYSASLAEEKRACQGRALRSRAPWPWEVGGSPPLPLPSGRPLSRARRRWAPRSRSCGSTGSPRARRSVGSPGAGTPVRLSPIHYPYVVV